MDSTWVKEVLVFLTDSLLPKLFCEVSDTGCFVKEAGKEQTRSPGNGVHNAGADDGGGRDKGK
jgi:hypothetical protein